MALDKTTVVRIAHLARINVSEESLEPLAGELSQIITWVEQLSEVDTEGVAPMTSVVEFELPRREDEVTDGGYPERVVGNAPAAVKGFFTVPKVIE